MKKITTLLVAFALIGIMAKAQNSNMVFYAVNGENFWLYVNGVLQNPQPMSNVKISNMPGNARYDVKVQFQIDTLGVILDKVSLMPGVEKTWSIKRKTDSNLKKGVSGLTKDFKDKNAPVEKYKITAQNEFQLNQTPPPNNNSNNNQQTVVQYNTNMNTQQNQQMITTNTNTNGTNTTQTTVTTTNPNNTNTSVNINAGGNGTGVGLNINITDPNLNTHTTTTTTTTTNGGYNSQTTTTGNGGYVSGYNGPVGCPMPMNSNDFNAAKSTINESTFEDTKLETAKQIVGANCLTADQVTQLCQLFTFEETKLDFAKYAYSYTYDKNNYFKVNKVFTFDASKQELSKYTQGR